MFLGCITRDRLERVAQDGYEDSDHEKVRDAEKQPHKQFAQPIVCPPSGAGVVSLH